ncbi:MAG: FdtA/QdtA family cupin domain-containing protein [bacterium]|nr:FdtA/QdtA family cupin domain-containing protein [bacterium]
MTTDRPEIKVKFSGLITLPLVGEGDRGWLAFAEAEKHVPFSIRRFYVVGGIKLPNIDRGGHAHKTLRQVIFCLVGNFTLRLDDGETKQEITMTDPAHGVILGSGLWHDMANISSDCVMLIVADGQYDEADYIRDYEQFKNWVKKHDSIFRL